MKKIPKQIVRYNLIAEDFLYHLTTKSTLTFLVFQHILRSFWLFWYQGYTKTFSKESGEGGVEINGKWQTAMKAILQDQNLNEQRNFWMVIKTKPAKILKCDC